MLYPCMVHGSETGADHVTLTFVAGSLELSCKSSGNPGTEIKGAQPLFVFIMINIRQKQRKLVQFKLSAKLRERKEIAGTSWL